MTYQDLHASSSPQDSQLSQVPQDNPTYDSVSFALREAQGRASRRGVLGRTVLIGTAVIVLLVGMTAILLTYTCVMHECSSSNQEILSTAPLGRVLTISQIASHMAPFSIPIVMGLCSNLLGAMWLRSSSRHTRNRPSPMQLGHLLSLCNGANLPALFSSLRYIFRLNNNVANKRLETPRPLRISIIILFSLLASTYLSTAADAWLHASSSSVNLVSIVPYSDIELATIQRNFGRQINSTLCDPTRYNPGTVGQDTCGLVSGGSIGGVPQSLPDNTTYTAQTLGVRSQCASMTKECLAPNNSTGTPNYGPMAALLLNCSANGIKYGNGTRQSPLCPLDANGFCTGYAGIPSNPFATGQVVTSQAYSMASFDAFDPVATGWFVHGSNGAWNVVYCNLTALEVSYTYTSLRYITNSTVATDINSTRHIMIALFTASPTLVSDAVNGAGLMTNMSYEQAYGLELSKQALARGAYIYEPRDVLSISKGLNVIGSRLQLIPLVIFVVATLIFAFLVFFVSVWTIASASGIHYVPLAAMHLNDPVVTVQYLCGHPNPVTSWEQDTAKRFGFESDEDRLNVGPVGELGGQLFAVTKGN